MHVLYTVAWYESSVWNYKVRLASIPNFSIRPHPGTITMTDLTIDANGQPYSFDLEHPSVTTRSARRFLGDYMNSLDTLGCQIVAGFIARDDDPYTSDTVGVYVAMVLNSHSACSADPNCYANCDGSTTTPVLNIADFVCFLERFSNGDTWANCDGSTTPPILNVADFSCFLQKFSAGCQ